MTCQLSNFKLPDPDVRLVLMNDTVHKVKLWFRHDNVNGQDNADKKDLAFWEQAKIQYDIERVMMHILLNPDKLEPIRTDDLVIYPYKKEWPRASNLQFFKFNKALKTSPNVQLFYIEKICKTTDEPSKKKRIIDVNIEKVEVRKSPDKIADLHRVSSSKNTELVQERKSPKRMSGEKINHSIDKQIPNIMATPINKNFKTRLSSEEFPSGVDNPSYVASFFNLLLTPMKQIRNIWKH